MTGGTVEEEVLERKILLPCSGSYFCGERYMTNGRSPSTILLAITDKMSMASEIVFCNLCYSLIVLWRNDKRMLVQNAVPKISCPVSAQWKSNLQNKLYPCQTCQCVTLKILWWREINLRVYRQNKWGRTKSHPYWFLWYQIQDRKKLSIGGLSNSVQNLKQKVLI